MKTYKILVSETDIVGYYVTGNSAEEAQEKWAELGYDSDYKKIEDCESQVLGCEEVTS